MKMIQKLKKETIKAKDLWKQVLTNYFESGNPFLCFKDTANKVNPNKHVGHISSNRKFSKTQTKCIKYG